MFYHLGKKSFCDLHFKVTSLDVQIGQQQEPEPYENGRYLSVEALNTIITAYPKLKTEFTLIYESPELRGCCGCFSIRFYTSTSSRGLFFFPETVTLFSVPTTTGMTTAEAK